MDVCSCLEVIVKNKENIQLHLPAYECMLKLHKKLVNSSPLYVLHLDEHIHTIECIYVDVFKKENCRIVLIILVKIKCGQTRQKVLAIHVNSPSQVIIQMPRKCTRAHTHAHTHTHRYI